MQISLAKCAPSSLVAYAPLHLRFFWQGDWLTSVDIELGEGTLFVEGSQYNQKQTVDWLTQYFFGNHKPLCVLLPKTSFAQKVHNAMGQIPFASTISYGELASLVGNAKASRAVGQACSKNPVPLVIPCHRVIANDASMCGFNKGINIKKLLIKLESRINKGINL